MRRFRNSVLLLLLAAASLAQTSSVQLQQETRRVGDRLACLCGACNNTVGTCAMIECHYAKPARLKIRAMMAQGFSDDQIVASFVKEYGLRALAAPPAEGFHLTAWVMPFLGMALGGVVVIFFLRRYRAQPVRARADELAPETLSRYTKKIEDDLAHLD